MKYCLNTLLPISLLIFFYSCSLPTPEPVIQISQELEDYIQLIPDTLDERNHCKILTDIVDHLIAIGSEEELFSLISHPRNTVSYTAFCTLVKNSSHHIIPAVKKILHGKKEIVFRRTIDNFSTQLLRDRVFGSGCRLINDLSLDKYFFFLNKIGDREKKALYKFIVLDKEIDTSFKLMLLKEENLPLDPDIYAYMRNLHFTHKTSSFPLEYIANYQKEQDVDLILDYIKVQGLNYTAVNAIKKFPHPKFFEPLFQYYKKKLFCEDCTEHEDIQIFGTPFLGIGQGYWFNYNFYSALLEYRNPKCRQFLLEVVKQTNYSVYNINKKSISSLLNEYPDPYFDVVKKAIVDFNNPKPCDKIKNNPDLGEIDPLYIDYLLDKIKSVRNGLEPTITNEKYINSDVFFRNFKFAKSYEQNPLYPRFYLRNKEQTIDYKLLFAEFDKYTLLTFYLLSYHQLASNIPSKFLEEKPLTLGYFSLILSNPDLTYNHLLYLYLRTLKSSIQLPANINIDDLNLNSEEKSILYYVYQEIKDSDQKSKFYKEAISKITPVDFKDFNGIFESEIPKVYKYGSFKEWIESKAY